MSDFSNQLAEQFGAAGFHLDGPQIDQFSQYYDLLIEWNSKVNLTGITAPNDVILKHFLDSALVLKHADLEPGKSLVDVGSGAGFPAVPLKILRPDLNIIMMDSLNKRVNFLVALLNHLHLDGQALAIRGEDAGKLPAHREIYDYGIARAVSNLRVLAEYILPLVKEGGLFFAQKGPSPAVEVEEAGAAIQILGGSKPKIVDYHLPGGDGRSLIVIRKTRRTPERFPRSQGKINKSPLE